MEATDSIMLGSIITVVGIVAYLAGVVAGKGSRQEGSSGQPAYQPKIIDMSEPGFYLIRVGRNKIDAIKEIRKATGLGLKEAKDLIDSVPCRIPIAENNPNTEHLAEALGQLGAEVQVRR